MVSSTYQSGQVEALFVFRASRADTGQLWIPTRSCSVTCHTGLQGYELGQWLLFDLGAQRILRELESGPVESQIYSAENVEDKFVQVRTPVVYFSDKMLNEIVAYSPQFGRIGSFYTQDNLVVDKLHYAWIAYMALYRDHNWQLLMKGLQVEWALCTLEEQLTLDQMKAEEHFVQGIVVGCIRDCDDLDDDENGDDNDSTKDQPKRKEWTVVEVWTYDLGERCAGMAIHRIAWKEGVEKQGDQDQQKLTIGTCCKFIPIKNWSGTYTAVSPFPIELPTGVTIVESDPSLKLKISHNAYHMDQDPQANKLHVPNLLGAVKCPLDFTEKLRLARQRGRTDLILEFISNYWRAVSFHRSDASPPPRHASPAPSASSPTAPPEHRPTTSPEQITGGFGSASRRGFTNYRSSSTNQSTTSGSSPSLEKCLDANMNISARPPITTPHPFGGGFGTSGGFGRPRHASAPRSSQPSPTPQVQQQQRQDIPRPPSVDSDFGDAPESTIPQPQKTNTSRWQSRPTQSQQYQTRPSPRRTNIGVTRGTTTAPFLNQCERAMGAKVLSNISGVIVSKSDKGFYIYTPAFPKKEIFLAFEKAAGLNLASWIRFDAVERNGNVYVERFDLDNDIKYEATVVRKTIQIKLNGMVPKRWHPHMSTFVPVINTDFVEEVVDSKGLLDQNYADAQLKVTIERGKIQNWPDYTWFIAKVEL